MALTIPNKGDALADVQSILFKQHLDILVAGVEGNGITSGCAVAPSAGMAISVGSGEVVRVGTTAAVSAATPTVSTAHATLPRLDLVVVTSGNAVAIRAGTAAVNPVPPAMTAGDIGLALVLVPAAITTILAGHITDARIDVETNSKTATALATARAINGTNFDGSGAITTSSWGTARTLTLGSTGKSVDGSAAVTWSLAEIGAQASNTTLAAIADGSIGAFGFRNKITNGAFGVAQRSTSLTGLTTAGYMTVDRWYTETDGAINYNQSQQTFPPGGELESGIFWYLRHQVVSGSGQTYSLLGQKIEYARTLNGKTATLSFWARADANRSIVIELQQRFGNGGSGTVWGIGQTFLNLTTTFQKFTHTINIPSISGKTVGVDSHLAVLFFVPFNTALTFDLTGVQLEQGAVATPFEDRGLPTEIALCQRYYNKMDIFIGGYGLAGTQSADQAPFNTTMRAWPTMTPVGVWGSVNMTSVTLLPRHVGVFWYAVVSGTGNYSFEATYEASAEL